MYAIIEDGSRQYRAEAGKVLTLDHREAEVGSTIELSKVLFVGKDGGPTIGRPLVAGAKVLAEVVEHTKVKTQAQSFRRRKASKRLRGHSQPFVKVKVKEIVGG